MSIFTLLINKKDVGLCQHFIVFHSKKVTANILQKTKIVCQKGQYEWFFVESVEFCKLNKPKVQQVNKAQLILSATRNSVYDVQLVLMAFKDLSVQ